MPLRRNISPSMKTNAIIIVLRLNLFGSGYLVENGLIKPDSERIADLENMNDPKTNEELQRVLGLFGYYAKWIPNLFDIVKPLVQNMHFLLSEEAANALKVMKQKFAQSTLQPIDEALPSTVETDASDCVIGETLNQNGKPIAFHVCILSTTEQKHSSLEKEARTLHDHLFSFSWLRLLTMIISN